MWSDDPEPTSQPCKSVLAMASGRLANMKIEVVTFDGAWPWVCYGVGAVGSAGVDC